MDAIITNNRIDSRKYSQSDFADIPDKDIMERAMLFNQFYEDTVYRKHFYYGRTALTGSGPVRLVRDMYKNETREMIYLASNDYLNLTMHPGVIRAGMEALEKYGAGAGSVPLLGGMTDLHNRLEERIAGFKAAEAALVFTSGFGSNAGTLLALLNRQDVAVMDVLAHASLVEGCSNTNIKVFLHNNMRSLERVLQEVRHGYRTKLVIVDGVYSMDGDIACLDRIVELARTYGAYTMVDDAHATGVIGDRGRGTAEYFHLEGKVDITAGTFSKALGGVGGFIAARKELIRLLKFYARSYIFSTAMNPQTAASLLAALDVIETEPGLRAQLWENIRYFKSNLQSLGFNIGNAETAIFPIIIGDDLKVKEATRLLHDQNIYVNPVMYPAVSRKSSRIRMSLMATHKREHLDKALAALETVGKKIGIGKKVHSVKHKRNLSGNTPMNILVTGATGFIGYETAVYLKQQGHRVSGLARDPGKAGKLQAQGIPFIRGDILDKESLPAAFSDKDIVIHCAAYVADWGSKQTFIRNNYLGTANVLEACTRQNVGRLFYISTVDIFGHSSKQEIDETAEHGRQPGWYARSKQWAEQLVKSYIEEGKLDITILYPPWVYGEGDTHFVPEIIDAIKKGEMLFFRNGGEHAVEICYIKNLTAAIYWLLFRTTTSAGKGYIIADEPGITFREFINTLADMTGNKPVTFSLPYWLSYPAAWLMESACKLAGSSKRPLLTRQAVSLLGNDVRYDISRLKATGYRQPYPFRTAITNAVEWYDREQNKF